MRSFLEVTEGRTFVISLNIFSTAGMYFKCILLRAYRIISYLTYRTEMLCHPLN